LTILFHVGDLHRGNSWQDLNQVNSLLGYILLKVGKRPSNHAPLGIGCAQKLLMGTEDRILESATEGLSDEDIAGHDVLNIDSIVFAICERVSALLFFLVPRDDLGLAGFGEIWNEVVHPIVGIGQMSVGLSHGEFGLELGHGNAALLSISQVILHVLALHRRHRRQHLQEIHFFLGEMLIKVSELPLNDASFALAQRDKGELLMG